MVVLRGGAPNMYSCDVLYIGSGAPTDTLEGVDAIQSPLNQVYPSNLKSVAGIDSKLVVLPDRLHLAYKESGETVDFPLDKLKICAALRSVETVDDVTHEHSRYFVPVNKIECDDDHPAIFSAILRRSTGRQIQECHSFICNTPRDALHLVNATASMNMALKKGTQPPDRTIVIQNGYQSDTSRREVFVKQAPRPPPPPENDIIYIRSGTEEVSPRIEPQRTPLKLEPLHYKIKQPEPTTPDSDNVIYISFDKTNLVQKEDDNYEMKPVNASYDYQSDVPPSPRPPPMLIQGPPRVFHQPPPAMMYGPPPPRPMFMRGPPPPRMYERRAMTPQARVLVQQPHAYTRTRARSSSPARYAASEVKVVSRNFHPRWRGHTSDIVAPAPKNFLRQNMFMNERAFANGMNGDPRLSRSGMAHYGYQPGYSTFYDRPVTKSNPKYSSSESSSDDGGDNRFDRSRRRH